MTDIKYRHELKYMISQAQCEMLKMRLWALTSADCHAGAAGTYNIRSLYFDDYYNRCYYENLNGTDPREKFRIRIYNHSPERIMLECKRKEHGKTLKTSCPITEEQCRELMQGHVLPAPETQEPVLRKLTMEMMQRGMKPAVIVEYDRAPFVYANGNVRITLDTNISSSRTFDAFLDETIPKRPVMPTGRMLLEVKFDEYLPDFIYSGLQLDNLQHTTYSKYFICRKFTL